jgi:ABC-type lipoprotein export system ATPase subunit
MLGRVGLGDRLRHKPSELSGGQRQRVSIARALINNPKIVWADEPTGDLDDSTTGEIMMLFKALNEGGGQTFVLVTHDVELAKGAKRIVRMHDGHIVEDKPQAEARHA